MRLLIIFFLIALPFHGRCQQQSDYHNSAAERIVNKSWECVRYYLNDKPSNFVRSYKYVTFFQKSDVKGWVGEKYKNRFKYCSVEQHNYQVDSLNNYIINSGGADLRTWLFIDSNSNKDGLYIVAARSPLYEDDGSGINDEFFEISFLSDTEFVISSVDRFGLRKSYCKMYPTPPEFYQEHKIQQH